MLLAAAVAAAGLWWTRRPAAEAGAYVPRIESKAWASAGPAVLIDDAHWNLGSGQAQLPALGKLLRADGYRVLTDGNATRAEMLADAKVAVIVNPLGLLGAARRLVEPLGLAGLTFFDDDGLLTQEIETTMQWVENGGSLLLAIAPTPIARGSRGLAVRLGVRLGERLVIDAEGGRRQVLTPPSNAKVLRAFGPSAIEVPRADAPVSEGTSVAGRPWAVTLEPGRGRVAVLGASDVLTWTEDGALGLQNVDNERFVRDVLRWLSRAGDPPRVGN